MHKSILLFSTPTQGILDLLPTLHLSSLFIGNASVNADNISSLRNSVGQNIDLYVEIPAFVGGEMLQKYPDARPVEAFEKDIQKDWYVGVCPTHPGVRDECLKKVKEALELDINGIWLDFIRYPTKWEEPEPYILDTCYCDRCLKMFSDYIGEPIIGETLEDKALLIDGSYYIEWLEFKALQITSMVKQVKELILSGSPREKEAPSSSRSTDFINGSVNKKVKLGIFAIPWEDKEYGAGIKRIIAQDFEQLTKLVDIVSPMLYHKMCGKDVEWIKQKVAYFWHLGVPFLPLIQTESRIAEISSDEFKKALEYASSKPSSGVCIFYLEDLLKQPKKLEIVKEFFTNN